jgi:uncharacterized membrane protein YhaH (DUF805 family)
MLLTLFTTFHGRISRKQWWIGFLIILLVSFPIEFYLDPTLFSDTPSPLTTPTWLETLWSAVSLIPATAITVKRFNDRDWPWWAGYAVSAAWLVTFISPYFGVFIDPDAGTANAVAFWIVIAMGFVAMVDNAFLRGTHGPNRYGDDPLMEPTSAPAVA